ncbi:hypothetical protein BZA77DRAFT_365955 [Pyronema omphalodes]|nr:hypothetical protein BZA77DRAFT_365955 [Pyronema omphalodes]
MGRYSIYSVLASILGVILILSSFAAAQGQSTEEDAIVFVNISRTDTTVGRITFASEPRGRGTVGILLSCTFTFVFCIWTVVHPNIIADSTLWSRVFYKATMMIIAVINPEGLVISAYGQWQDARRLNKAIIKYFENIQSQGSNHNCATMHKKRREWLGMDGAFFVVMGGFVIDTSECVSRENIASETMRKLVDVRDRSEDSRFTATLTPAGFLQYLNQGYFDFDNPPFQRTQIADKGKASNIAKVLSASQAGWLLIQSAARWAAGLRLSLLEIHIIIQVFCTALIFYFWWYKPLDVDEPIHIVLKKMVGNTEEIFRPIQEIENFYRDSDDAAQAAKVLVNMESVDIGREHAPPHSTNTGHDEESARESPVHLVNTTAQPIQDTQHQMGGAHNSSSDTQVQSTDGGQVLSPAPQASRMAPVPFNLKSWKFIHPLRRPYTITRKSNPTAVKARALHDIIFYITGGTITDDPSRPSGPTQRIGSTRRMFIEGAFIGVIAGLHALAWNVYFPTEKERIAWRFSCIGMFAFPLIPIIVASLTSYHDDLAKLLWWLHLAEYKRWEWTVQQVLCIYDIARAQSKTEKDKRPVLGAAILNIHIILILVVLLMLLGYLICIVLITIESYVSIRDPPKTTFITPRWIDYWPHM